MKEKNVILLTAILNAIVASLKLVLGIAFSFSTLIADSIQSFVDFLTDLISIVTNNDFSILFSLISSNCNFFHLIIVWSLIVHTSFH